MLEDNIKVHVKTGLSGVGWLHQAEDIIQAQVLEKTVMNSKDSMIWHGILVEQMLTSCEDVLCGYLKFAATKEKKKAIKRQTIFSHKDCKVWPAIRFTIFRASV